AWRRKTKARAPSRCGARASVSLRLFYAASGLLVSPTHFDFAVGAPLGVLRLLRAEAEVSERLPDASAAGEPGEYGVARDVRVRRAEVRRQPSRRHVLPELQVRVRGERGAVAVAQVVRRSVQGRGLARMIAQLFVGVVRVVLPHARAFE